MKKRLFLIIIFLIILIADVSMIKATAKTRFEVTSKEQEMLINKKDLKASRDDAIDNNTILGFVAPSIFILLPYLFVCMGLRKFKAGTVNREPKFRKQMPRGCLV